MSIPSTSPHSTIPRKPGPDAPRSRRSTRPLDPFSVSDCILYPELIDLRHAAARPGWWRRLRHALADCLDDEETQDRESRVEDTRAVRRYQEELHFRVRLTTIRRVRAGWWHGPAPYGYHLQRQRTTDETGRPAQRGHLIVNAYRAPVVPIIFAWYVHNGLSEDAIAVRLAADPAAYPPPQDPITRYSCRWTPARVRTILDQPGYLGYVVWGRVRRGQPVPSTRWYVSAEPTHPALVDPAVFWAARDRRYPGVDAALEDDPELDLDEGGWDINQDDDGTGAPPTEPHTEQPIDETPSATPGSASGSKAGTGSGHAHPPATP